MSGTAAPLGPLKAPTRARGAQRSVHAVRTCALAERPSRAGKRPRSATRVAGISRNDRESAWAGELRPGNDAARPPSLRYDNIDTTVLPEHLDVREQPRNAVLERFLGPWDRLEARYKVVVASSAAFVLCNMDKVNISVAIIPMAQDFGWSPTVAGLVQSSFFYGYMLTQIPGGYVTSRVGGRRVLPFGVGLWSVATAAVPFLAGTMPGLLGVRAAVGLGEGVAPSAATDMVARVIAPEERSRAISFIFGGLHVGSLLGLLVAPLLIDRFGWQTVFYMFGAGGLVWAAGWEAMMGGIEAADPATARLLEGEDARHTSSPTRAGAGGGGDAMPWRGMLRNTPVRALAYTHFCNNWFHYTMMAWLPTFFSDTLSLSLTQAAQVSLLPPVAAIAATAVAGPSADALIARGWPVASVRRLAQATAFLGPAACLTAAAFSEDGPQTVALVTGALGLASFSLAGLYCNHADLSPRYAPFLLGLTNTSGAVPGIIGVVVTGAILDRTGSWPLALFVPSVFFFLTGIAVFAGLGTSDAQDFSDNGPFWIERKVAPALARLPLARLSAGRSVLSGALARARRLLPGAQKPKDS